MFRSLSHLRFVAGWLEKLATNIHEPYVTDSGPSVKTFYITALYFSSPPSPKMFSIFAMLLGSFLSQFESLHDDGDNDDGGDDDDTLSYTLASNLYYPASVEKLAIRRRLRRLTQMTTKRLGRSTFHRNKRLVIYRPTKVREDSPLMSAHRSGRPEINAVMT
ncbi:hypothetical protein DPMN_104656 [Dreissena polymorpha]|uniref:Uncharacterized protein n=1 Tax=Dreissena polymorpha TaxID=45954 RepID=A0A9D4HDJ1_DREPO|nr:hypothetical protein DPMN_104656 [Dreissena polymorpha]